MPQAQAKRPIDLVPAFLHAQPSGEKRWGEEMGRKNGEKKWGERGKRKYNNMELRIKKEKQ